MGSYIVRYGIGQHSPLDLDQGGGPAESIGDMQRLGSLAPRAAQLQSGAFSPQAATLQLPGSISGSGRSRFFVWRVMTLPDTSTVRG